MSKVYFLKELRFWYLKWLSKLHVRVQLFAFFWLRLFAKLKKPFEQPFFFLFRKVHFKLRQFRNLLRLLWEHECLVFPYFLYCFRALFTRNRLFFTCHDSLPFYPSFILRY